MLIVIPVFFTFTVENTASVSQLNFSVSENRKPIDIQGFDDTDLLYASVTKSVGIFAHGKLGNIDWKIVKRLMFGSIPASILTTFYLRSFQKDVSKQNRHEIATISKPT